MSARCERCDDDGWVCENCHEPEARCECEDELDMDEHDELPEMRRCKCNPYVVNSTKAPT